MNGIYAASDGQNLTSDSYTNTTPPDSNTTNTTNESSSSGTNPEYNDYQNNDYQAAGEAPPSFTNEQIIQAALNVKRFLEGNKYLPEYITINGIQVNQATFLQLLTTTTIKINNSDTTLTELFYVKLPGTGTEKITPGTLTQTEYLTLAQNIQTFINSNGQAPATMSTVFGNIKFQSLLYLYTRALSMYQTYGTLPTFLAVRPWSNIPITDTNKNTITTQDIINTAIEVKNFVNYYKYLPDYITINGIVVNQATFLQLLTTTTTKINNNDNTPLTLQNIKQPTTGTETTTPGTLTKNEYLTLAENIQTFINNNGQAPATMNTVFGNIKFQSLLYLYTRALSMQKTYGTLPTYLAVRPWSNIPITDTNKNTITTQDIINTAIEVKNFVNYYKYLPDYITINGIVVNQATFLQLLTTTTTKINNNDNTPLTLQNIKQPTTGTETTTPGTLTKNEYLTLAQNIQTFINNNGQAPATMNTVFGNIKFQSLLYLYTRALSMQKTYGTLPTFLAVRPWSNIPITDTNKNTITTQDIINTAIEVKNFVNYYKYLPDYITINGIVVNQATFLQLLTTTTTKINNNDNTPLTLTNTKQPTTGTETTTPGTLTKNEYLTLAQNIQTFINNNGQAPATITSTLGDVKFESLVYMYSRILSNYKTDNNVLPLLITVRSWSSSNIPVRDEFFTIQQITKTAIEVKNFLEGNKYLPEYITVNGVVMNQSQFIYLLVTATSHANAGDSSLITLLNANKPVSGTESIIGGNLLHDEYINIADSVKAYIEANKKAPSLTSTSLGDMNFQSLLYMYCRILNQNNLNQELPISINVKPWKTTNIPIYDKASFTISEITQTAVEVKAFVDANGHMPEWITVGGVLLNQSQFLHLLTSSVILINNQNMNPVKPVNAELPSTIVNDDLSDGTLSTDSYVLLAQQIKTYIEQNKKGPNSITTDLGTTSFKSLIYMYSRILQQYKLHQTLPTTIILKNWTTPIYDDHFTPQEIIKTATDVKVFFDGNGYLPEYITISGVVVNQAQFLQLLVTTTLKINSADNSSTYLQKVALPTSSYEKMSSGNINLADYIPLAQSIYEHITVNQVAAGSFDMILGKISFPSQLYLFSNVLDSFQKNQHLPESIYVKTWKTARTIGTTSYGNVVVLGAYGNLVSSVKIAYIVGVHPIESASHQALIEAIEAYDNSLAYCYYIYKVSVTKDASNYEKGRMNGQLLANMFAVPEIKAKKYSMAIDIHSNVGNWAQNRFVFSPISGGSSESLAWTIKNRIGWLSYFFPPSQTSPQYVTIPLIQGGIPAIIYETYTYESYDVTRSHANDFVWVVDGLAF